MARPKIPLDENIVIKLAAQQCSDEMIGAFFNCDGQTVRRRYGKEIDAARHNGKSKLLGLLFQKVEVSDRLLEHALNRYIGPIPSKVEITDETLDTLIDKRLGSETKKEMDEDT